MSFFQGGQLQLGNSSEGVSVRNENVTWAVVDGLRKQFESGLERQRAELEKKCDLVLAIALGQVQNLRTELEQEKKARRELEERSNKCNETLKEGLVYVTIEIAKMDMQLEELAKTQNPAIPVSISKPSGSGSLEILLAPKTERLSTDASEANDGGWSPKGELADDEKNQVQEGKACESEGETLLPMETGQSSTVPEEPNSIGSGGHGGGSGSNWSSILDEVISETNDSSTDSSTDDLLGSENQISSTSNEEQENEATTSASLAQSGVIAMALSRLPARVNRIEPERTPAKTSLPRPTRYQCKPCKKGFSNKASYQNHWARTHKKKLAHPCPQCGRTFTASQNLARHLSSRHPENKQIFPCPRVDCLKAYTKEVNLHAHIRDDHDRGPPH